VRQRERLGQEHLDVASEFKVMSYCKFAHNCAADFGAKMEVGLFELDLTFLSGLQFLDGLKDKELTWEVGPRTEF
jgi:hypothetical protein